MQYYYPQKIAIEEPTLPDVFTDREEIIERLVQMALEVPRRRTSSMVLLGRRRIGKTSVLLRVYNWLFSEQEEVVPIYINLEKCGKTIADFGERYFLTFLMQYLAFKRKDCGLFEEKPEFQWLYHIGLEHPEDKGLQSILRSFKIPWDEGRTRAFHTHAIYAPATVSALNESSIFVMVDEFQHINSFLYRDDSPATATITGYYQTVVESFKCPHLLSGSAVRMMMYRVINGPLAGRFDFEFLEPLSDEDSIEFMAKLSAKEEIQIGEEEKNLIVERTGSNPYYIDCMIRGAKKQRITRLNKESLNEVFAF
ncbi:MAG: ATP-binding protein, partial [Candidatus Aminicenantales bacterium]